MRIVYITYIIAVIMLYSCHVYLKSQSVYTIIYWHILIDYVTMLSMSFLWRLYIKVIDVYSLFWKLDVFAYCLALQINFVDDSYLQFIKCKVSRPVYNWLFCGPNNLAVFCKWFLDLIGCRCCVFKIFSRHAKITHQYRTIRNEENNYPAACNCWYKFMSASKYNRSRYVHI